MISKRSEFQISCDFCQNSTDWAIAPSEYRAGKLFHENDWRAVGEKHKCPDCIKKDDNCVEDVE